MRNYSLLHSSFTPKTKICRYFAFFELTQGPLTAKSNDPFFDFEVLSDEKEQFKVTFNKQIKNLIGVNLTAFELQPPQGTSGPPIPIYAGTCAPLWGDLASSDGIYSFTVAFVRPTSFTGITISPYLLVELLCEV